MRRKGQLRALWFVFVLLMVGISLIIAVSGEDERVEVEDKSGTIKVSPEYTIKVVPLCEDNVVCYMGYGEEVSCFRDSDLINKYC